MFEIIYFTDFTVGSLIPACFFSIMALFLLNIKGKSKATFHLGLGWAFFGTIPLSYLFASSIYHPNMAYLRWINAVVSIPSAIHILQFFFHFPSTKKPKLAKFILFFSWIVFLLTWTYFIIHTFQAEKIYKFSGHFWDLNAELLQEKIALIILFFVLLYLVAGFWKIIITKRKEKKIVIGIVLSFILGTIPVAIANVLSRHGMIERGTFIFIYNLFVVLGFFLVFILYINITKDKTSFLAKIIGISLVTFFLVLQIISSYSLQDKETSFDEIKKWQIPYVINQVNIKKDIDFYGLRLKNKPKYIIEYSIKQKRFTNFQASSGIFLYYYNTKNKFINAFKVQKAIEQGKRNFNSSIKGNWGFRFYREDPITQKHYICYLYSDTKKQLVYEVGFDYLSYRSFIHPTASRFILLLISVVIFILFGFRIFFLGALIRPLNSVLQGLKAVNTGKLNIRLPIFVEDEIGYLAKSFNQMVRSIRVSKMKLQRYADDLELKVSERTKELQVSLDEIQKLKIQQDGDYYLTSLLIRPLGKNQNKSKYVDIDFLVAQKKRFQFRTYKEEIGGDICVSYSITLKGKPYTVFLNGDAMGKSMQGAGGALILGSVFRAIIDRTNLEEASQNVYPEKWLKNSFIELHKVFESFDGSMLISMILGIVEDETGFMCYINAEHPFAILYRDSKATFLEDELMFRKLGTLEVNETIYVRTFQFEEGDVIIVGSDGKDDIEIEHSIHGGRVINEDETVILKMIEINHGDLNAIYNMITEMGDLKDDLSLLRIKYKKKINTVPNTSETVISLLKESKKLYHEEDYKTALSYLEEAYQIEPYNYEILRYLMNTYQKLKNYSKAEQFAEKYFSIRPYESEYLYALSYFNKMIGNFEKAAEIGERLRIRNPKILKNLINLVETYYIMKNYKRAKILLQEGLDLDPKNEKLNKIKKDLESIRSESQ
ncbi:MAG: SpoIIE family protein phosphatase [Leptospiraceae bacterium]|nr:SpoIIE family protein phosphatase [Leptospiraceae bacterium]MCP5494191.1 SpoIIE family protein phosphatase [Leptospiraceae bacterium]